MNIIVSRIWILFKKERIMKKHLCLFLSILFLLTLGCKTLTSSFTVGASIGALTGAGWGGAIHYQNRKRGAALGALVGAGVGLATGYYFYKDQDNNIANATKNTEAREKEKYENKISEALNRCLDDEAKPQVMPKFVPSQVKGGRLIGDRVDWVIKTNSYNLSPEKQQLLEDKKGLEDEK